MWKQLIGVDDRTVIERSSSRTTTSTWSSTFGAGARASSGVAAARRQRRRWLRELDLGTVRVVVEAEAQRVDCAAHGVVAAVPWARHDVGFTRDFEDQTAWPACHASKSAITQLVRVAWVTVGRIIARVVAERGEGVDWLEGCGESASVRSAIGAALAIRPWWCATTRVGWCGPRQGAARRRWQHSSTTSARPAVARFAWSAPMRPVWIGDVVADRCPAATRCTDPFHVCQGAP